MPRHAVLLTDVHVGCTPFEAGLRIGGTMEFSGVNLHLDRRRIDATIAGARESFHEWAEPGVRSEWAGMRPIAPDGLPIIDRAAALREPLRRDRVFNAGYDPRPPSRRGDGRVRRHRHPARRARALRPRPFPPSAPAEEEVRLMEAETERLRVGIVGSGNIGSDLMLKIERSPTLELAGIAGIDPESDGLARAAERGHWMTADGLPRMLDEVERPRPCLRRDLGPGPPRARRDAGRARHPLGRPDPGGARSRGDPAGEPDRAPRRRRHEPRHLRRAGDGADRRRDLRERPRSPTPRSSRRSPRARPAPAPARTSTSSPSPRRGAWSRSAAPSAARRSSCSTPPSRRS